MFLFATDSAAKAGYRRRLIWVLLLCCCQPLQALDQHATVDVPQLPDLINAPVTAAEFTQARLPAGFTRPLLSTGSFIYHQELGLLWRVQKPVASELLIAGTAVYQDAEPLPVGGLMADLQPLFAALFAGNLFALHAHFQVQEQTSTSGWHWILLPRQQPLLGLLASIDVYGDAQVRKLVLQDQEQGRTELVFGDFSYAGVDDADTQRAFAQALPASNQRPD